MVAIGSCRSAAPCCPPAYREGKSPKLPCFIGMRPFSWRRNPVAGMTKKRLLARIACLRVRHCTRSRQCHLNIWRVHQIAGRALTTQNACNARGFCLSKLSQTDIVKLPPMPSWIRFCIQWQPQPFHMPHNWRAGEGASVRHP